ncbi:MAG: TlpA disulfide reductase family protein [Blastocatellia bacterium]
MFQRTSYWRFSLMRLTRNLLLAATVLSFLSCSSGGKLDSKLDSRAGEMSLPMLSGGNVKLNELVGKNKVVLVNFWATWCGPCRREIPDLKALHNQFKDKGVEIVGLTIEDPLAATDQVKVFTQQFGMDYRIGFSTKEMFFMFNKANGSDPRAPIPQTFIFGKDGKIVASVPGLRPDFRQWAENAITQAL